MLIDGYSSGHYYVEQLINGGVSVVHLSTVLFQEQGLEAALQKDVDKTFFSRFLAFIYAELNDEDTLVLISKYAPLAILAGRESAVELADFLAYKLCLPGNDYLLSHARRDKYVMHNKLISNGIPGIKGIVVSNKDFSHVIQDFSFPVVAKPVRGTASENVTLCHNLEDLEVVFDKIVSRKNFLGEMSREILVQEFIEGDEYAINMVSCQGIHGLSDIWSYSKRLSKCKSFNYDKVRLVEEIDPVMQEAIAYVKNVLDQLGVVQGPSHTEIKITNSGPILIECASRPMGGNFPLELILESLGHNQISLSVLSYLDQSEFINTITNPYKAVRSLMLKLLIVPKTGRVRSSSISLVLSALPSFSGGSFLKDCDGHTLSATVDLFTCPGHIVLSHADSDIMLNDCNYIIDIEQNHFERLYEIETVE